MQQQANRSLRNPFDKKKSKSRRLGRLLTFLLVVACLLFISIFYILASQAFLSDSGSVSGSGSSGIDSGNPVKVSDSVKGENGTTRSGNANDTEGGQSSSEAPVIAYAISLTSCAETPSLIDGAAVLQHSIHLSSIRNTNPTRTSRSKYDYQMYAIIHHNAKSCEPTLQKLGYTTIMVDVPVQLQDIKGQYLRDRVHDNGCCGELEFIKLWAYTLTSHPMVVHLDLDTVILQPLDELFDAALGTGNINGNGEGFTDEMEHSVMWEAELKKKDDKTNTKQIDAFFTRDYNMVRAGKKPVGVQGGFLVLRPSQSVFEEFQTIIREGNYDNRRGWGALGYAFYGSMTFQGIIPYYYDALHRGTAIELNRCIYNQMADNPRDKRTVNDVVSGQCRDGRENCEDCRERDIQDIVTAHFTLCQKPWECLMHNQNMLQHRLCRKLSGEWYRIRADWEQTRLQEKKEQGLELELKQPQGKLEPEHFRGFCNNPGKRGHIPIQLN